MNKMNTMRVLLSLVVNFEWNLYQFGIKNVFLHRELKEEIYMELPPRFSVNLEGKVCKLKKVLYRLKQSPQAWFEIIIIIL